ncbi:Panacea domain-containing protein [Paraflavitalea speifideaquila]|uniref:Panacea domain-containing protein n=1 Tax=Paraflavitalea speifideaquila TaxID=3076558 RepID=UPI0028E9CEBF|nr:Panacea domain-containing protein [Paraflavitalea speifideiaquila]
MDKKNDIVRFLAPVLYVLSKTGQLDKHQLFKILYFADKAHIAAYGRTFTEDVYVAMLNGPVPSRLYDYVKIIEGKYTLPVQTDFVEELSAHIATATPYIVIPLKEADGKFLSRSAIKFLDESISKYRGKSFGELTEASHDEAWKAAARNDHMSTIEIAKSAGVNDEMLKYIQEKM